MNYIEEIAQKIKEQVPKDHLPSSDRLQLLFDMYAVLLLAKGMDVTGEDVHNAWAAWMSQDDATHKSIKPFDSLSPDIQQEDEPFVEAVRRVASTL